MMAKRQITANKLKERCEILEKIVKSLSIIYKDENTSADQKKLIETTIGAAIFYLPHSELYWTGRISKEAIDALIKDPKCTLTKEHQFPRKIAAKELLTNTKVYNKEITIQELYEGKYAKYNYVTPSENKKISRHQRDDVFEDIEIAYANAEIELVTITSEDLKKLKNGAYNKVHELKPADENNEPKVASHKTKQNTELPAVSVQKLAFNKDKNHDKIIGVSINSTRLGIEGILNTSSCYKAFIEYCIDNHADSIQKQESMQSFIKADKNDPKLIKDIKWDRVKERGGWYYCTHASSLIKKDRMIKIANELSLHVEFFYELSEYSPEIQEIPDPETQEIPDTLNDFINQVRQYKATPGIESEMMDKLETHNYDDRYIFDDIISNNLHNNKPWMRIAVIKIPMILKYTFFDNIGNYQFDYQSALLACAIEPGCFEYIESAVKTRFSAQFHYQFISDVLRLNGLSIEELHQDENYEEYVRIAIAQNPTSIQYIPKRLRSQYE